jgi:hypothetical protein
VRLRQRLEQRNVAEELDRRVGLRHAGIQPRREAPVSAAARSPR